MFGYKTQVCVTKVGTLAETVLVPDDAEDLACVFLWLLENDTDTITLHAPEGQELYLEIGDGAGKRTAYPGDRIVLDDGRIRVLEQSAFLNEYSPIRAKACRQAT